MVISCSVPSCKNRFQKGGFIQFHSFPLRRVEDCKKWAQAIGRLDWKPTKNSFVCSQHFKMEDYQIRPGKHKHYLREGAIPTVFKPTTPKKKGAWRATIETNNRLPFILPNSVISLANHRPIQPKPNPSSLPLFNRSLPAMIPTSLPGGVSIMPVLRRIAPAPDKSPSFHSPPVNGKKLKRTDVERYSSSEDENLSSEGESPQDIDVTQFLSISLQPEEEKSSTSLDAHNMDKDVDFLQRKCLLLQQELRRRDNSVKTLESKIVDMQRKFEITAVEVLRDNFKGISLEILEHHLNNGAVESHTKRYSRRMKEFAIKLYICSPKAYSFVREHFHLPHPSNVTHWLRSMPEDELKSYGEISSSSSCKATVNDDYEMR